MQKQLEDNCYLIQHELELSKKIVNEQVVCEELTPLKEWLLAFLKEMEEETHQNLYHIELNLPETFPQIFKRLQGITRNLRYCDGHLVPSICRYKKSDNVSLKVLGWLHNQHPDLVGKPFGISDNSFSIVPSENIPTIYYLPSSSQHILLHLPLFFHEMGHDFYMYHRPEMLDLVKELQKKLLKFFALAFQGNNNRSKAKAREAKTIVVDTWIYWIEELYCDAVGIRIGGAGYIHAFSFYLRMVGRAAFFQTKKDLANSSHPVPWLRVKFLVHWAKEYGLVEEAKTLEEDWNGLAKMQGIRKENYFGYYRQEYYEHIKKCLDDMLVISEPIFFQDYNQDIEEFDLMQHNYIQLTNLAWRKFYENLKGYEQWEQEVIKLISNGNV